MRDLMVRKWSSVAVRLAHEGTNHVRLVILQNAIFSNSHSTKQRDRSTNHARAFRPRLDDVDVKF
jgi:hypothetical protein